jgi:hypothetical protein
MPAPVVCPTCGSSLDIPPDLLGRQVRCASCGSVFTPAGDPGRPPAEPAYDRPRPRSRLGCLWALLGVAVLSGACCCGGCVALVHFADNPTLEPYTAPDQSYTASFPGTPGAVNRFSPTGKKVTGVDVNRNIPAERFFVEYVVLSPAELKEDPQKLLNTACDQWLATVPGGQEARPRYARDFDGFPAMDLFVSHDGLFNQNNNLLVRVVKVNDRLYSVGVAGQITADQKHGDEFLDSFHPQTKK